MGPLPRANKAESRGSPLKALTAPLERLEAPLCSFGTYPNLEVFLGTTVYIICVYICVA